MSPAQSGGRRRALGLEQVANVRKDLSTDWAIAVYSTDAENEERNKNSDTIDCVANLGEDGRAKCSRSR